MTTVLFDVTRIFVRGSRFSPTGIDRVVMAYARWLLTLPHIRLQPVLTFRGMLFSAPRATLARMVEQSEAFARNENRHSEESETWNTLRRVLNSAAGKVPALRAKPVSSQLAERLGWYLDLARRCLLFLRPIRAKPGSIYLNVSHTGLSDPNGLRRLSARGVRSIIMVHDIIPITFPEYCSPKAEGRHQRRMEQILGHSWFVVTNSATTAAELTEYARELGRQPPRIAVAPLGIETCFQTPRIDPVASSTYFVCVGTLEARKNLAFLLALWRRLAERMGSETPRLVIVGRRGWENESVIDHLQRSKSVIRLVHEVCDLNDDQLSRLVAGATALLGPSLAEGFDLPVVEALSLGTPVIASDIPVHRELAPTAVLLDPLDGPAWLAAIESAARNPGRGETYAAPTWEEHFSRLAEIIDLARTG